jgi:GlpG protein
LKSFDERIFLTQENRSHIEDQLAVAQTADRTGVRPSPPSRWYPSYSALLQAWRTSESGVSISGEEVASPFEPARFPRETLGMRPPPSPALWLRFPVTSITSLLAILTSIAWWQGMDISCLFCTFEVSQGQIWRFVTSILPHINLIHLAFDIYWFWVFGTFVEGIFGHWRMLALLFLFAVPSSAAEYALSTGGVGLSGVVYGLFGMLWVLSRRDIRFASSVDARTIAMFVAWFFLCIAATTAHIMEIGNVAHAAGAAVGLLLGAAIVAQGGWRKITTGATAAFVLFCLTGALVARPYINRVADIGGELAYLGYRDLERGQYESSIRLFNQALERNGRQGGWWYNLGVAYSRLNRHQEALGAFEQAVECDPRNQEFRDTRDQYRRFVQGMRAGP